MKKQLGLAALGLAGLTAGAGAGLVLTGGSGSAVAQTSPTAPDTTAPDTTDGETPDRSSWAQQALAPLVEDGTITQAQADAVIAALKEARPDRGPGRGGHGGFGRGRVNLEAAAEALGLTTEELRTQLRDGQTITAIAEAEGVDVETVKAAMLAAFRSRQQELVTAERLTQDQADANTAAFEERLDELVNKSFTGRRDDADDADDDGEEAATTDAPTTEAPSTTG